MGTVFRRLGRPLWAFSLAASLPVGIAPTYAQTTTPIASNRALVTLPENQLPSMRLQNFGGSVYERLAIRRGLIASGVAAGGIGGATWAGQELSARMPAATASTWRSVAMGGIQGAVTGAATGCIAGAAAGLVTAGVLSGPGCMAAGLGSAIVGGMMGAYGSYVNLDEGGTVKIPIADLNALVKLAGTNAAAAQLVESTAQSDLFSCPKATDSVASFDSLIAKYGSNVQFACQSGNGIFLVGQIVTLPYRNNPNQNLWGVYSVDDKFVQNVSNGIRVPSLTGYTGGSRTPDVSMWIATRQGSQSTGTGIGIFVNPNTHSMGTESFKDYVKTVAPVATAPAWASVLGSQINSSANQLKLSNAALAGILNALHKQMTNDGSLPQGLPAYDPSDPITLDDVQAVKDANPTFIPTIGDLSKPFTTPGREPLGGTASAPVAPPQDVNVVTGGTGSGTTPNVTVNATVDLGPSGDTTLPDGDQKADIPLWDDVTAALDPWRNLVLDWPQPQCPVYPINANFFGGQQASWNIDIHCQLIPDGSPQDALLGVVLMFVYGIMAVRKVLEA